MAEESGNKQENGISKTALKFHLFYLCVIAVIIIIGLMALLFWQDIQAGKYLNVAATITSIILSVLAIFMSLLSNDSLSNLMHRIRDITSNLLPVSKNIKDYSCEFEETNKQIITTQTKLTDLMVQIESFSSELITSHNSLVQVVSENREDVKDLNQKMNNITNTNPPSNIPQRIDDAFYEIMSYNGLCLLYCFIIAHQKKIKINLEELVPIFAPGASGDYLFGMYVTFVSVGLFQSSLGSNRHGVEIIEVSPDLSMEKVKKNLKMTYAKVQNDDNERLYAPEEITSKIDVFFQKEEVLKNE